MRRRFVEFVNIFSLFRKYLHFEQGVALHLKKKIPFTRWWFVLSLVEIDQVVLEKKIFTYCQNIFCYFAVISPWTWAWPFIWTNLNILYPRMLCVKFGWNWPCGSREEDKNVKSLRTDGQTDIWTTDDRQSEELTWAFSSGEVLKIIKIPSHCSTFSVH